MRGLPVSRRGMGTGAFQSGFFLGLFVNPIVIVALEKGLVVPRAQAVGLVGFVLVALAIVAAMAGAARRRPAPQFGA